jgi:hypothetical protein
MSNKVNIGLAGRYYAAVELEQRTGWSAVVNRSRKQWVDIRATNPDGTRTARIQVKTRREKDGKVPACASHKGNENFDGDYDLFCVVTLRESGAPTFHIMPRETAAQRVRTRYDKWLPARGRNGQPHRENPVRILDLYDRDLNHWDL